MRDDPTKDRDLGKRGVGDQVKGKAKQAAGEVQMNAAQKFRIRAQAGVRNAIALHFGKDERVNEVANGNGLRAGRRGPGSNFRRKLVQAPTSRSGILGVLGRRLRSNGPGCQSQDQRADCG